MPVRVHGISYATVAERLAAAHGEAIRPVGIQAVHTEALVIGDHVVVHAEVTFTDGRRFSGLADVIGAESGAQASNPLECAETSAVGRALAMAGYFGSGDGLAGAEEVRGAARPTWRAAPAREAAVSGRGAGAASVSPATSGAKAAPAAAPAPATTLQTWTARLEGATTLAALVGLANEANQGGLDKAFLRPLNAVYTARKAALTAAAEAEG